MTIPDKAVEAAARAAFINWYARRWPNTSEDDHQAAWHCMPDHKRATWIDGARPYVEAAAPSLQAQALRDEADRENVIGLPIHDSHTRAILHTIADQIEARADALESGTN